VKSISCSVLGGRRSDIRSRDRTIGLLNSSTDNGLPIPTFRRPRGPRDARSPVPQAAQYQHHFSASTRRHFPIDPLSVCLRSMYRLGQLFDLVEQGEVLIIARWALLPLVARQQIAGGPELYGILFGAIGPVLCLAHSACPGSGASPRSPSRSGNTPHRDCASAVRSRPQHTDRLAGKLHCRSGMDLRPR
jgi:hypothetical protein